MGDRIIKTTGCENELIQTGRQLSVQPCRLESERHYSQNKGNSNPGVIDDNSNNSASVLKNQLDGSSDVASFNLKPKLHNCDQCGKSFDTRKELNLHKQIHEHNVEKCPVAKKPNRSKCFDTKTKRQKHNKDDRSSVRKNSDGHKTCPLCAKKVLRSNLADHIRTHTKEKPYVCSVCNQGFAQSFDRYRHQLLHTGEKPYVCPICNKGFARSSNLKRHKALHTGEKRYICQICSKAFKQQTSLKIHEVVHTGEKQYVCTVCSQGFKAKTNLEVHKRTHTGGEKPYSCLMCSKQFTQKGHLQAHLGVHTKEKPYQCPLCDKSFNRLSHQKRHSKNCHGKSTRT